MSELLVVTVAYRNDVGLDAALRGLGSGYDVLVVDNETSPRVRGLAERYGAAYLAPGGNVGFAAAVNLALRERSGRHVLLLNPDATIGPGVPEALVAALDADPQLAAVAPQLYDEDGKPERVSWPIPSPRAEWMKAFRFGRPESVSGVFLIGAVLLLRAEAIDEVGAFDERYFLYAEECDWQLRALHAGWRIQLVEELSARHAGAGSNEVEAIRRGHFQESGKRFALKWYGRPGWVSMRVASLVGSVGRLLVSLPRSAGRSRYGNRLRL